MDDEQSGREIMNEKPFLIGISGGSGSGKTTLTDLLSEALSGMSIAMTVDDYYKNQTDVDEAIKGNFDHPDAIDELLFSQHLEQLKAGQAIDKPCYDFTIHARQDKTKLLKPKPIIIIDGVLLFALPPVFEQLDMTLYVDTPADIRLARRIVRDVHERGRTVDSVIEQYLATVRPMHNRYVEPSKAKASRVISGVGPFDGAVKSITESFLPRSGDMPYAQVG